LAVAVAIALISSYRLEFFMHEWALAEAVIAAAKQIAEKEGLKQITEIDVKVGELQGVEKSILRFALSQLKTAQLKNAKIRISTAKATMKCKVCGITWRLQKNKLDKNTAEAIHFVPEVVHTFIKCPKCGSPDFEIVEGRGVWLESIKGAK
jgi:hydrogenase nickel incorporation protein HypA/HybF